MIEEKIASGIEVQTITMLRQLPRKRAIISDTSTAETIASRSTPHDRAAHEHRLVEVDLQLQPLGRRRLDGRQRLACAASTTASVEASAACRIAR